MAENGIDEPVIGLAFDGTGYGNDGHIWGSEFMICDFDQFERHSHFAYMLMPGGDRASEEPWRMGLSLLYQAFADEVMNLEIPLLQSIPGEMLRQIIGSMKKKINCPLSSGAGRLFDAVAAITGICTHSMFHAEAPMRLEAAVKTGVHDHYHFELTDTISFIPAIRQICDEMQGGTDSGVIAARFHNTIIEASVQVVTQMHQLTGLQKVVLSGGSFQNKYLVECLESRLVKNNFAVFTHSKVPCNDGGLALGQLAIAARRVSR
jgi:hydrogenase maturation protein HypF